jgi:membrane-associated phospholipid phosphatase
LVQKICLAISLFVLAFPVSAETSTFRLSPALDIPLAVSSVGLFATSRVVNPVDGSPPDARELPWVDRRLMRDYDHTLDRAGTATAIATLLAPGVAGIYGSRNVADALTYSTMYLEAFLFTTATKDLLKAGVPRWRPYAHHRDPADLEEDDRASLPSGHTAYAFMGAAFLTTALILEGAPPSLTRPAAAIGYAMACGTGALRVASGEHFVTDVLAGAAIGTLFGWAIPQLHARNSSDRVEVAVSPVGVTVSFEY